MKREMKEHLGKQRLDFAEEKRIFMGYYQHRFPTAEAYADTLITMFPWKFRQQQGDLEQRERRVKVAVVNQSFTVFAKTMKPFWRQRKILYNFTHRQRELKRKFKFCMFRAVEKWHIVVSRSAIIAAVMNRVY